MNKKEEKLQYLKVLILAILLLTVVISANEIITKRNEEKNIKPEIDTSEPVINEEVSEIENTIKISFVGDLVLNDTQYNYLVKNDNFDNAYKYVSSYLEQSDYVVGFLSDNLTSAKYALKLKKFGVNLLSISHQDMLANDTDELFKTVDILNKVDINNIGVYQSNDERDNVKVIEIDGIKIAILSYVDKINGYTFEEINENFPYITSMISTDSKYYNEFKNKVESDFIKAKSKDVDLILVFSNIEQQYKHSTNLAQDNWNKVFIDNGADIVLGNYSTSVQPIEYIDGSIVINSAGSILSDDMSSIVNIYIDKDTKKVITSSIVPLYIISNKSSLEVLPIYNLLNNSELAKKKDNIGEEKILEELKLNTEIMFGNDVKVDELEKYYYYTEEDYKNIKQLSMIEINEEYKNTEIYKLLDESKSITFIGDSITAGSKNDKHPWYESLIEDFDDKKIINISKGGYTVKRIVKDYKKEILASKSDLYIIAIGINDIRYRDKEVSSMTGKEYVKDMESLVKLVKKSNSKAKIVLIPPWTTLPGDKGCKVDEESKQQLIDSFSEHLKEYAENNRYVYIDPNKYLDEFFENNDYLKYMVDVIHPNSTTGVTLYSKAIFEGSK